MHGGPRRRRRDRGLGGGRGYVPWAHAILWVVLAIRAWVMPTLQWRQVRLKHRPLRPGTMGIVEMVFCVLFLVTIA
ncbi:hypothetical protein [Actinomyces denticolens]|uniref:hypothetical protein n=1 Tax=Actinomyces denticolens TaxID=52767 RepID=UPI00353145FB